MTPKEVGFKLAYEHYEAEDCTKAAADKLAGAIEQTVQHNYEVAQAARAEMEKALAERDELFLQNKELRRQLLEMREFFLDKAAAFSSILESTEKPVGEVTRQEAAALLDPKSPGWAAGTDRLLKELGSRKSAEYEHQRGVCDEKTCEYCEALRKQEATEKRKCPPHYQAAAGDTHCGICGASL